MMFIPTPLSRFAKKELQCTSNAGSGRTRYLRAPSYAGASAAPSPMITWFESSACVVLCNSASERTVVIAMNLEQDGWVDCTGFSLVQLEGKARFLRKTPTC